MEQVDRIKYMEQILNEGTAAVTALEESLTVYRALQNRLQELFDYYHSPQWMQDLEDDRAGLLPAELKRGILSEDAVWDLETSDRASIPMLQDFLAEHQGYLHK